MRGGSRRQNKTECGKRVVSPNVPFASQPSPAAKMSSAPGADAHNSDHTFLRLTSKFGQDARLPEL